MEGTGGSHFERLSSINDLFANNRPLVVGFVSKSSLYHLKSYLVGDSIKRLEDYRNGNKGIL